MCFSFAFSFAHYHSWANVHNVNHKYCIHFWFSLFLLSTKEKTTLAALTASEVLQLFYKEALFLCTLYYVNFLTRSRQPIHNSWVDAAQVKTQMYSNCSCWTRTSVSQRQVYSLRSDRVCLMILQTFLGLGIPYQESKKWERGGAPSSYSSSRRRYILVSLLVARDVGWQNTMFWSWSVTPQVCPSYRHMLY